MSQTLPCPRNHAVPFADEDRGGEVYCPVCGVACPVPAADDGAARCRNGHRVPVAADGTPDAYCPTCGVAVEAAATPRPARPGRVTAFSAAGAAAATAAVAGTATCPGCAHAFPFTVAQSVGTVYCPKCGTGVAVGQPRAVGARPAETGVTPLRAGRRGRSRRVVVALGLLAVVLAGAGYVAWQHPDEIPFVGGALPWNRALIGSDAAEVPPPPPPPAEPPRRPGEVITLAMIEALPGRPDRQAARDDARAWQVALAGDEVPATDPRRVLLEKVIVALRAESQKKAETTAPPAAPPPKSDRGPGEVVRLLEQARERATPERATEAMEVRAKALFLAPRVPQGQFRAGDAKRLEVLEGEVTRLILQARGRRAAADAGRCLAEGDDEALRRLVADGQRLLPEFTDQKDCLIALQTVQRLAGERAPRPTGSTLGRAILFRCDYEEAMELVRRAEPAAGVAAAARAHARAPDDDARRRLAEFVFEALDAVVARATDPTAADRERERWTAEARRALDAAGPWRADPRWSRLDAALRAADPAPGS